MSPFPVIPLSEHWRLASDGDHWMLQKYQRDAPRRGYPIWDTVAETDRARAVIEHNLGVHDVPATEEAKEALRALPDWFADWKSSFFQRPPFPDHCIPLNVDLGWRLDFMPRFQESFWTLKRKVFNEHGKPEHYWMHVGEFMLRSRSEVLATLDSWNVPADSSGLLSLSLLPEDPADFDTRTFVPHREPSYSGPAFRLFDDLWLNSSNGSFVLRREVTLRGADEPVWRDELLFFEKRSLEAYLEARDLVRFLGDEARHDLQQLPNDFRAFKAL